MSYTYFSALSTKFLMIQVIEPIRWQSMMLMLNTIVSNNYMLSLWVPVLADIFVFTYPLYLTYLYLKGYYNRRPSTMKLALHIALTCLCAVIVNLIIQMVVIKSRPEQVISAYGALLLPHLPTAPFPSDHASVSRAFFMSLRLGSWALAVKIRRPAYIFFALSSLVMCISRVAVWVHRPTDIITGIVVWSIVAIILSHPPIMTTCDSLIYRYLIRLQHFCFRHLGIGNDQIKK